MTTRFVQIHFLTAYGANNLNRDDQSQPKTLLFGNANRLRISSQSIKRAWRMSDFMRDMMVGQQGVNTKTFWSDLGATLVAEGFAEDTVVEHITPLKVAMEGVAAVKDDIDPAAAVLDPAADPAAATKPVKAKSKKKPEPEGVAALKSKTLFFFNQSEISLANELVRESLKAGKPLTDKEASARLADLPTSVDVAMFGRMVAGKPAFGLEGAVQVAHLFTVNKVAVEDDYFTAVDDLAKADNTGSAHVGNNSFASGLYYGYVNIDVALLTAHLEGDTAKVEACIKALVDAVATVAPGGKQNTFAARSNAMFLMVEAGDAQPRAFADVFLTPVKEDPMAKVAADRIMEEREWLAKSFPSQATRAAVYDRANRVGSMPEVHTFIEALLAD
jgi:CRISPR system Cascade subunit CasC